MFLPRASPLVGLAGWLAGWLAASPAPASLGRLLALISWQLGAAGGWFKLRGLLAGLG